MYVQLGRKGAVMVRSLKGLSSHSTLHLLYSNCKVLQRLLGYSDYTMSSTGIHTSSICEGLHAVRVGPVGDNVVDADRVGADSLHECGILTTLRRVDKRVVSNKLVGNAWLLSASQPE